MHLTLHGNSTLRVIDKTAASVFDICNIENPADDSFESTSTCVVVSRTCNCFEWFGVIETPTTVKQLKSSSSSCVRVHVQGNTSIVINWYLRKVGFAVPKSVRNVVDTIWRRSMYKHIMTSSDFLRFIYKKMCNPLDFGVAGRLVSRLNVVHIVSSSNDQNQDLIACSLAFTTLFLFLCVLYEIFKHGQHANNNKKTE
jgi:hypothetical protein